tara:strand:- start:1558 stop:1776 length:219 start_codon:yes stop_codon:yes gene_type:complete
MTHKTINNEFKEEVPTALRIKIILENFDELYQDKLLIKNLMIRLDGIMNDGEEYDEDDTLYHSLGKIFKPCL